MNRILLASLFLVGNAYALPPCPSSGVFHNCFGTKTFADGGEYVGEWKDGRFHGQGTRTWASGTHKGASYVGGWKGGETHGQATFIYADGDKYVGEFREGGLQHGQGTYTWANGDKYVGEFKDGKKHGWGEKILSNSSKYVGEWKDNNFNGQGTLTWANGNTHVGEFKDGKFHGQGTFKIPSTGFQIIGEYKNGLVNGHAVSSFPNGLGYVGEFKDSKQHGYGCLVYIDGAHDLGEFRDGEQWNAVEYDKNGDVIGVYSEGRLIKDARLITPFVVAVMAEFWEGRTNGLLVTKYTSGQFKGDKYVGEFKDSKIHGLGIYLFADGDKYLGQWKNNLQHGLGTEIYNSMSAMYVGEFKFGKFNGQGTYTVEGGKYVGEWKDGLAWTGIAYDKNGSVVSKAEEGVVTKIGEDDKNVMDDTDNK
jgi:hypothetical protein